MTIVPKRTFPTNDNTLVHTHLLVHVSDEIRERVFSLFPHLPQDSRAVTAIVPPLLVHIGVFAAQIVGGITTVEHAKERVCKAIIYGRKVGREIVRPQEDFPGVQAITSRLFVIDREECLCKAVRLWRAWASCTRLLGYWCRTLVGCLGHWRRHLSCFLLLVKWHIVAVFIVVGFFVSNIGITAFSRKRAFKCVKVHFEQCRSCKQITQNVHCIVRYATLCMETSNNAFRFLDLLCYRIP